MAAGLRIWDASGNLVLDASHRVMRFIGMKQLAGGLNDGVQDDRMKQGGFISVQPDSYIGYLSGGLIHPTFSIDTTTGTVSWSWASKNSATYDTYVQGYVYYGAY
ncbi:hypothetical protein [Caballeronia sp. S22]|uniref:hypothetical protein n=1 Tax=Caballeronia sp. S22 TaxID=3137182 RepID=UPI0035309D41